MKIPVQISVETDKISLTFIWKSKGPRQTKMLLEPTSRFIHSRLERGVGARTENRDLWDGIQNPEKG